MDRRSKRRVLKAEKLLSAELKKRAEKRRQWATEFFTLALRHATAVAAISLSGQPKFNEPLSCAWMRALRRYGVGVKQTREMADQGAAAQQLFPIIIGCENESARFTDIFRTAPIWLLVFTATALDARLLKFELPDLTENLRWGSDGFDDARQWPLLPCGTMTAGDAIPRHDARQVWIAMACVLTIPVIESVDDLLQEDSEDPSLVSKDPLLRDISFALDLDHKPESEWSAYEKRRMRVLAERILRLNR